jgi:hypothetical protein
MAISLTKEEVFKCFEQRRPQFDEALKKRIKPELPLVINSYADLTFACTHVVFAFLETVFAEDK